MSGLIFRMETCALVEKLATFAEVLPEFGEAVFDLLDSGEELFTLQADHATACLAGEIVVRLDPSDSFLGLVAAFRTRNPELLLFEHLPLLVDTSDSITTQEDAQ